MSGACCDQCGRELPPPARASGRRRVHCSKACARKAEKARARLRAELAEAEASFSVSVRQEYAAGRRHWAREIVRLRAELEAAS